jgi:hypothetical protein
MAVEAAVSSYNLKTLRLYAIIGVVVAVILAYDGYCSKYEWSKRQDFYQEHFVDNGNQADSTMKFNQYLPPFLIVGAVFFAAKYMMIKDRKIVADENELNVYDGTKIAYDSIEKIDKTHFDSKGYFVITYKDDGGSEADYKLSDKKYDNLPAVLDHIVAKIS